MSRESFGRFQRNGRSDFREMLRLFTGKSSDRSQENSCRSFRQIVGDILGKLYIEENLWHHFRKFLERMPLNLERAFQKSSETFLRNPRRGYSLWNFRKILDGKSLTEFQEFQEKKFSARFLKKSPHLTTQLQWLNSYRIVHRIHSGYRLKFNHGVAFTPMVVAEVAERRWLQKGKDPVIAIELRSGPEKRFFLLMIF